MKSTAMNRPDERLDYLALRKVFFGDKAKFRSVKAIRKQINKHLQVDEIQALRNQHPLEHIYEITKDLLEDQVFESTLKAKIRFPEVFDVSPAQSADREQSEAAAARTEAEAIKDAVEGRQPTLETPVRKHDTLPSPSKPIDFGKSFRLINNTIQRRAQSNELSLSYTIAKPSIFSFRNAASALGNITSHSRNVMLPFRLPFVS